MIICGKEMDPFFSGENGMVDVCTGHCDVLGLRIGELRPKALLSGLVLLEEVTIAADGKGL